ncbi:class I SAM-dependent methyltransferase [Hymenobacter siberiensis]|jgi:tRNA (cmo5U34)-methyltransferase|uniref:class I SAM-dependent methyltransferase n=1 Tax=Hymenobacter siberiensis TaxID=2848396 RepID=UPI001C1E6405|nr:class I SAM-dependent methyltransferase [Hymenobacter siberiensis]MBU6122397.1 class I SAM-dependent methyltransferase [Hymenobacter siberiensis]
MASPPTAPFSALIAPEKLVGFDRAAWFYDALAALVFGTSQQAAQRAALRGLPGGAPHVLILGGGTGWVLGEVLRRAPAATVLYLEASPRMLARARARLVREHPQAVGRVEFRHGTQAALQPAERFGAIITFFVLDCVPLADLEAAVAQLRAAQGPGAPWLVADFRPARRGWRHWLLQSMYTFFWLTTGLRAQEMPDLRTALGRLGLVAGHPQLFFGGAIEALVFRENPATAQP